MIATLGTHGRPASAPADLPRADEPAPSAISARTSTGLVACLAAVVPNAAIIRITISEPDALWAARAYDRLGNRVDLPLATSRAIARWVAGDYPGADWCEPHDLDLATGLLAASRLTVTAGR